MSKNEQRTGLVTRKDYTTFQVLSDKRLYECTVSPLINDANTQQLARKKTRQARITGRRDPVAVGDQVIFNPAPGGRGVIVEILERRTQMARQEAGNIPAEQVMAANLDQLIPVVAAAKPAPRWNMLDRYLVTAEANGLSVVICINKADLMDGDAGVCLEVETEVETYRQIGYKVLFTSTLDGRGLDVLRDCLKGRHTALMGKSGVGKTSLLNAIQPGLGRSVGEVSQSTRRGRHVTTQLELLPLDFGGFIADTPGMRQFALTDRVGADPASLFPEMRPYLGKCRFRTDCRHDEEPGCAIRAAVMRGEISPRRYQSYMRMKGDI